MYVIVQEMAFEEAWEAEAAELHWRDWNFTFTTKIGDWRHGSIFRFWMFLMFMPDARKCGMS
jgi:hypothetical protein